MEKKIKRTLLVAAVASTLAISGVALADPGGPFKLGRFFHGLNLTESQEDAAIAVKKDIMKEGKKVREAAMESLDDVAAEVRKPKPDAAKLHHLADQRIDEVRKVVHFAIDRFLTFHQVLTPEQKNELAEHMEKAQRRAKKWEQE